MEKLLEKIVTISKENKFKSEGIENIIEMIQDTLTITWNDKELEKLL